MKRMSVKTVANGIRCALVLGLIWMLGGCAGLPKAPSYPNYSSYGSREATNAEARRMSDALEQYIKDWLDGRAPAEIPDSLLPPGRKPWFTRFRLVRPNELNSQRIKQWTIRKEIDTINWDAVPGYYGDPHVTYMVHFLWVPIGTKVHIEGNFPHSRYFSLQVTPPFDPNNYRYDSIGGVPEVPLFDADIEPEPGSVNPFRVGANRNAANRLYKTTFVMAQGDPVALNNGAFTPPYYRAPGNTRYGGTISYQGPWGDPNWNDGKHPGHKRGVWDLGQIWLRYYAPDKDKGAFGGVRIPKITYELPDGRQFFIVMDLARDEEEANRLQTVARTLPSEPRPNMGPNIGWYKSWGIPRGGFQAAAQSVDPPGKLNFFTKPYIRDLDRGVFARGEKLPAPGNYEPTATSAAGVTYLGRAMSLGAGKVFALSGRLPTTPRTRNGEPVMQAADARYWSLTSYDVSYNFEHPEQTKGAFGGHVTSIMDDEIVTDRDGWYTIVYSRPADRPANATAQNGVTWVDWGPTSYQAMTLRWLSIHPDWTFEKAPDEAHLQRETDWASTKYDPSILERNNRDGFLGDYQPIVSYLTRAEFEALGAPVNPHTVPPWNTSQKGSKTRKNNRFADRRQ